MIFHMCLVTIIALTSVLKPDCKPPLFTLPEQSNQHKMVHLSTLLHQKRIVLIFVPEHHQEASKAFLQAVVREHSQFQERDLVAIAIYQSRSQHPKDKWQPPIYTLADREGKVAREYQADCKQTVFYLIGKDGGIKLSRHGLPDLTELYAVIDAMPMRQLERRRQRSSIP